MEQPPPYNPAYQAQPFNPQRDDENLNLLAIFHYVLAGLESLGIFALLAHYMVFNTLMSNPEFMEEPSGAPVPPEIFMLMRGAYVLGGFMILAMVGINIAAGLCLKKRKNRTFILIVSGLNCLNMPMGTILGVFSFILLMKPHIADRFASNSLSS